MKDLDKETIKTINSVFKHIGEIFNSNPVEKQEPDEDGGMGFKIVGLEKWGLENTYLKIKYWVDSYGENTEIEGITFVEPTQIIKTNFNEI